MLLIILAESVSRGPDRLVGYSGDLSLKIFEVLGLYLPCWQECGCITAIKHDHIHEVHKIRVP